MTGLFRPLLSVLALMACVGPAPAQDAFPSKPVHLLVPYPAGGAVDIIGRTLGDELAKTWHQSVVIENRPGAGGSIATQAAATAPADGYTIILVASGHALNPLFYAKLPYDTFKDFTPLTFVGSTPNMLLVRADSPMKSVQDVIDAAKAAPGKLAYGHAGNGTSNHLAGELLKYMAKIDIAAVPYKGGAPSMNDLLGGHIPLSINNVPESLPQVKAGAVRALGATTAKRSPSLPDVPSIGETVAGYDTGVWWGLLAPAGLPKEIAEKLEKDCADAVRSPVVKERLMALGAVPEASTGKQLDAHIHADYDKWGPIIKAAGIKAE